MTAKRLLIVAHVPSDNTRALRDARPMSPIYMSAGTRMVGGGKEGIKCYQR